MRSPSHVRKLIYTFSGCIKKYCVFWWTVQSVNCAVFLQLNIGSCSLISIVIVSNGCAVSPCGHITACLPLTTLTLNIRIAAIKHIFVTFTAASNTKSALVSSKFGDQSGWLKSLVRIAIRWCNYFSAFSSDLYVVIHLYLKFPCYWHLERFPIELQIVLQYSSVIIETCDCAILT